MEIRSRSTITIEKKGDNKFRGKTKAKTMRGWINGFISKSAKKGNTETEFMFREILNAYNFYHPEKQGYTSIDEWKGKSSFQIIRELDGLTITKYQRKDKYSQPKEQVTKVTREELIALIDSMRYLKNQELNSFDIAFQYCIRMNIRKTPKGKNMFSGDFKEMFYSYRTLHNKFTIMLNALEELDLIEYSAGNVKILNKTISVRMLDDVIKQ